MSILIKNTHIIRCGGEKPIVGSIAIKGDTIAHVGVVPDDFAASAVIDGSGFIAMPGLVNAHTHSAMGLLRNLADDLPFADWLFDNIIPAETKLTGEDIYWGALLGIAEMLKSGTTCFADMYLHMDHVARAVEESGIRANLSFGPITSDVRGGGLIVDNEKCTAFMNKWNNSASGRIKTSVEIHSVYLFDEASVSGAAALAKELDATVHIHLSESDSEISQSREKYGLSPVRAAYEFGVFNSNTLAAHCVKIDEDDMALLKRADVNVAHCPSSNLKLANGIAPASRLAELGVNLCLGTDGSASNNNLNMFEEMHLAALLHKGISGDPKRFPAGKVIETATENGAKALGFDNTGVIKPGYKADVILIDANKPHLCPTRDVRAAAVYSAQGGDVDTVIIDGSILLRGGRLLNMDEELIKNKAREIAAEL